MTKVVLAGCIHHVSPHNPKDALVANGKHAKSAMANRQFQSTRCKHWSDHEKGVQLELICLHFSAD